MLTDLGHKRVHREHPYRVSRDCEATVTIEAGYREWPNSLSQWLTMALAAEAHLRKPRARSRKHGLPKM